MATRLGVSSVVARDCEVCGQEVAAVRFVVTEPLVWTTSTMVGADCYASHRRGVDLVLARDRHLVVTEVAA